MYKRLNILLVSIFLLPMFIPNPAWAPWVPIKGCDFDSEPVRKIEGEPGLISLCLDSNDFPHIAWTEKNEFGQREMYYLKWNGSSWVDIDGSGQDTVKFFNLGSLVGSFNMCLDSAGRPHIAWDGGWITEGDYPFCASEVYYLRWNGSQWVDVDGSGQESMKVGTGYEYDSPFLCLDSDDKPHLLLMKEYASFLCNPHVCYLRWDGSKWMENRGPREKAGDICDISKSRKSLWLHLDSNDQPHIALALEDKKEGKICYLYWIANRKLWGREFIKYKDPEGYLAPSVCLDSRNYPHIAYLDAVRKEVHYLQWNGSEWTDPEVSAWPKFTEVVKDKWEENQWWKEEFLAAFQEPEAEKELMTHIGESVESFSLCLDLKDRPHIAYMDSDHKGIYYLKWIPAEDYCDRYTYYIKGYVRDENGRPVSGVNVTLSGDICGGAYTTSKDGYYEFIYLLPENYTVTPHKSGCSFSPGQYEYGMLESNKENQDFKKRSLQE